MNAKPTTTVPYLSPGELLLTTDGNGSIRVFVINPDGFPIKAPTTPEPTPTQPVAPTPPDNRPHSRACGIQPHHHGPRCSPDCPTCAGMPL